MENLSNEIFSVPFQSNSIFLKRKLRNWIGSKVRREGKIGDSVLKIQNKNKRKTHKIALK